jgi:hypothetical protein
MAAEGTKRSPERDFPKVGAPGFEPGTSCPPDKRANQAAPRPVGPPLYRHPGLAAARVNRAAS